MVCLDLGVPAEWYHLVWVVTVLGLVSVCIIVIALPNSIQTTIKQFLNFSAEGYIYWIIVVLEYLSLILILMYLWYSFYVWCWHPCKNKK